MKKIIYTLIGVSVLVSAGCSNSGGVASSNNWSAVGSKIPGDNIVLNSIVYGNNQIYTGGSVDVNNPAVFNYGSSWQLTGGNYIPNPDSLTEQVSSLALDVNGTVYAGVNVTLPGVLGIRQTTGFLVNNGGSGGTWQSLANESAVPDIGIINSVTVNNGTAYVGTGGYDVNNNIYYGHVYSCTGTNSPWQMVGGGSLPDGGQVYSVLLSPNETIYAGGGGYNLDNGSNFGDVYASINNGNWQQIGGGSTPDSGVVTALALLGNNQVYAATSNGNVYISSGGANWQALVNTAVPDSGEITSISLSQNGSLYVATNHGNVYSVTANQSSWQLVGGGSMPDGWYANSIVTQGGTLYAATQAGNVYSTSISQ